MTDEENKGPQIDGDELLDKHYKWARDEKSAASDAGLRREEIGQVAEKMALENKALSQFRAGMKIPNEGKRIDWLLSMEQLIPIAREQILGNQPQLEFDGGSASEADGGPSNVSPVDFGGGETISA